jgi:2-iminobutanoate/2-iminopropanoate deaminase
MAPPAAGYWQVAVVNQGKIVYVAGQVPLDNAGQLAGRDDFRAPVEQIFKNLDAAVEAAGGTFHDVI